MNPKDVADYIETLAADSAKFSADMERITESIQKLAKKSTLARWEPDWCPGSWVTVAHVGFGHFGFRIAARWQAE